MTGIINPLPAESIHKIHTILTLNIWTPRPDKTALTQISLLLQEQADQSLHCLLFHRYSLHVQVLGRIWQEVKESNYLSHDMRFPTIWYVQPARPQISLRIPAV